MSENTIPSLSSFMDRRSFVRTGVYTGAAIHLATSKSAIAQETAEGKVLKVGIVGCGDQADRLINSSKNIPGIQFVACADIWEYNRIRRARLIKSYWGSCNEYSELSEMLEKQKDLDCVIVASPDFEHAPMTRQALQAGKAVYCEKMMTNTIEAAKDMVRAQRETGGILQVGHQRHSNPRYINARDNVLRKENLLGQVTHCYGQWNRGIAQSVPKDPKKTGPISQEVLNRHGYGSVEEFLNWRFFAKYGGGPISDLGAHQIDMFNWFFDSQPVSVMAMGGVDYYDGTTGPNGQTKAKFELPDNVMAMFEYKLPTGTMRAYYQVLTTTGSQGYYEKLMGTDGTLVISEAPGSNQVYKETSNTRQWDGLAEGANPILARSAASTYNKFWEKPKPWTRPKLWLDVKVAAGASKAPEQWELGATLDKLPHQPHLENFFEAARKKDHKMLNCPVEQAYRSCVTVLRCYDSIKSGSKYIYTPEDFTV
jgi:predicted dehydrogenase